MLALAVNDSRSAIWGFMTEGSWSFPVMLDADRIANTYAVRGIPTTVLIDQEGHIVKKIVGPIRADELSALVDDLTG